MTFRGSLRVRGCWVSNRSQLGYLLICTYQILNWSFWNSMLWLFLFALGFLRAWATLNRFKTVQVGEFQWSDGFKNKRMELEDLSKGHNGREQGRIDCFHFLLRPIVNVFRFLGQRLNWITMAGIWAVALSSFSLSFAVRITVGLRLRGFHCFIIAALYLLLLCSVSQKD